MNSDLLNHNESYSRFFEIKEHIANLNKELKTLQPTIKQLMQDKLEISGKRKIIIRSPKYPKVIEYAKSTTRATLSKQFIREMTVQYLTEVGSIGPEDVDGLVDYIDEQRDLHKRATTRLSYKAQKRPVNTAASVTTDDEAEPVRI